VRCSGSARIGTHDERSFAVPNREPEARQKVHRDQRQQPARLAVVHRRDESSLGEAAQLEHNLMCLSLMCLYLYAALWLSREVSEGVTEEQLAVIDRWNSPARDNAARFGSRQSLRRPQRQRVSTILLSHLQQRRHRVVMFQKGDW
jgi:hypothetical protein